MKPMMNPSRTLAYSEQEGCWRKLTGNLGIRRKRRWIQSERKTERPISKEAIDHYATAAGFWKPTGPAQQSLAQPGFFANLPRPSMGSSRRKILTTPPDACETPVVNKASR